MNRLTLLATIALPLSAVIAAPLQDAVAQEVGRAGAVNPAASSAAPGAASRTLNIGARVVFKERIVTTGAGTVQVVFLDKTTLNVGPNSELLIDEFVYDPRTDTGRITATMARGVLRFVGGAASHSGGATVRTPVATIGIRGGVATITHGSQGTRAVNHFGTLSITSAAGSEIIRRPGFAVTIAPATGGGSGGGGGGGGTAGGQISSPQKVAQGEVDSTNQQLTSSPSQSGGAPRRPTDNTVVAGGVGRANSLVSPNTSPVQGQSTSRPQQQGTEPVQSNTQLASVTQSVNQGQQQAAVSIDRPEQITQPMASVAPPVVTQPVVTQEPPGTRRAYALSMSSDSNNNGVLPYVSRGFTSGSTTSFSTAQTSANTVVSPVLGFAVGGRNADGTPIRISRVLQAGLSIAGQGAAQSSTLFVMTSTISQPGSDTIEGFDGGFRASSRTASNGGVSFAGSSVASLPGGVYDSEFAPIVTEVDTATVTGNRRSQGTATFTNPQAPLTSTGYTFTQRAERIGTPPNLGVNRPTQNLIGFVGGTVTTILSPGTGTPTPIANSSLFGVISLQLDDSSSRFGGSLVFGTDSTITGALEDGNFQVGYQGPGTGSRSAYVDYANFAARESGSNTPGIGNGDRGDVNGAPVGFYTTSVVTSGTVGASGAPYCACSYTQWGFWNLNSQRARFGGGTYNDQVHLGTWVAGRPLAPAEMPTTGTASYAGHAIGSIRNGASEYVAVGGFNSTVNFGQRTGTFGINNLDGRSYAGSLAIGGQTAPENAFVGTGTNGQSLPTTASVGGYFYGNPNGTLSVGAPLEKAGQFELSGPGYSGSGIFQARQQ